MIRSLIVLLFALQLAGCATVSSWFDGVLGGDDNSAPPAELKPIDAPVKLEKVWSTSIGDGSDEQFVNLVPYVDNGVLYVADRSGRVQAMDAQTGRKQWSVRTGEPISAGPSAGHDLVLIGTSNALVIALNAADGTERWRTRVSSEVLSVPDQDLDRVIVQTSDGTIAGLSAQDGKQVWLSDRTAPVLTMRGTSTPAVEHGAVLAGFSNGKLVAFSAENGFVAWETSIAIPKGRSELERIVDIDGDPVVAGDAVYVVTYQGRIARVDIRTGSVDWERDMSSGNRLDVDFSQVYVTDDQGSLWALSRSSGASVWKTEALANRGLTAPVSFHDDVVVGDALGYLHLLSRVDGKIIGREELDSKGVKARPVVAGDMLYTYGNSGKLVAWRLPAQSSD